MAFTYTQRREHKASNIELLKNVFDLDITSYQRDSYSRYYLNLYHSFKDSPAIERYTPISTVGSYKFIDFSDNVYLFQRDPEDEPMFYAKMEKTGEKIVISFIQKSMYGKFLIDGHNTTAWKNKETELGTEDVEIIAAHFATFIYVYEAPVSVLASTETSLEIETVFENGKITIKPTFLIEGVDYKDSDKFKGFYYSVRTKEPALGLDRNDISSASDEIKKNYEATLTTDFNILDADMYIKNNKVNIYVYAYYYETPTRIKFKFKRKSTTLTDLEVFDYYGLIN